LDAARERAQTLINAAKAGRDLIEEEEAAKAAASQRLKVSELLDLYLKRKVTGKLRTAGEIDLRLRRALSPIRDRYADDIKRRDVRSILDAVADRGALREAEKQRQLIGVMFRWGVGRDIIEFDPTAGIESYGSSPRRDRVLQPHEIKGFWEWVGASGMPPDYCDALKLQILVGARIGEVGGMRADEVDATKWLWTLPSARSKNGRARVTPLIGLARDIVEERLKIIPSGPLFTTEQGDPLTSNTIASLIVKRRAAIPISHFTSHDLRRTVATGLVDLGFSYEITAAVLGHEAGSKISRTLIRHYVRTDLIDQKRQALEAWDRRVRAILAGQESLGSTSIALVREVAA
jgi:integrase